MKLDNFDIFIGAIAAINAAWGTNPITIWLFLITYAIFRVGGAIIKAIENNKQ